MERPSFVRHGVLRLPPGFRFHPTDQELVLQYLRRKAFSCPLPASIIPELDLARYSPWDLPPCGSNQEERYFFNLRETKYPGGNQSSRATESGYWKATGKERAVRCSSSSSSNNQQQVVVGMKKVLVFYQGKPHNGRRTDWMMHEYRLAGTVAPTRNWVLCRIFSKNRGGVESQELMDDNLRPAGPSSSSSSDSSCITEMISEEEDTSSSSS